MLIVPPGSAFITVVNESDMLENTSQTQYITFQHISYLLLHV